MSERQIPAESWKSFLDAFTRQHHGWLVNIDDSEPEPLEEVRASGRDIEIRAGSVTRRIPDAKSVRVAASDADETAIDHVEIASGSERLTIRFRAAISPELVDGVAPAARRR
jgi:hypothetical protein